MQRSLVLNVNFYHRKHLINPYLLESKYIYRLIVNSKCTRPYSEKKWQRILSVSLTKSDWSKIYCNNYYPLKYKKLCEFKYKILLDILPCGNSVSKWNSKVSNVCKYCKSNEDVPHMLFECKMIKPIWITLSNCLSMNIKLQQVILGIRSTDYVSLNKHLCIAIVAYSIFSNWCKSSFDNVQCNIYDLKCEIRKKLAFYKEVYKLVYAKPQSQNLQNLIDCMLYHLN